MNGTVNPVYPVVGGILLLLVIVCGLFALTWHGDVPAVDTLGVIGTIIGVVVGGLLHANGVTAGANAAGAPMPPADQVKPKP